MFPSPFGKPFKRGEKEGKRMKMRRKGGEKLKKGAKIRSMDGKQKGNGKHSKSCYSYIQHYIWRQLYPRLYLSR